MNAFEIDGKRIGKGEPCYVIAEAGVNHECDLERGKALIKAAKKNNADAIKFQTYKAGKLATKTVPFFWKDDNKGTSQYEAYTHSDKFGAEEFKILEKLDKLEISQNAIIDKLISIMQILRMWKIYIDRKHPYPNTYKTYFEEL